MKKWIAGAMIGAALMQSGFAAEKPNIIFILADDWGMGDIQFYGGERCKIETPNMDQLARDGMAFMDAHSASSVCTPTRYAVLTGRYNWRSTLKHGVLGGFSSALISSSRETVASMMKSAGYQTACIGKWHLGMAFPTVDGKPSKNSAKKVEELTSKCNVDWSGQIGDSPVSIGFDYYWGISASLDMPPYIWIENDRFVGACTTIKAFHRPGPAHADFEACDVLPTLAKKTCSYIAEHAKTDSPFFIYMPLNSPHTPISPSRAFQGKSSLGAYGDFVMETDWAVGEVVKAVDAAGIADNTLIIVTADNGCSPSAQKGAGKDKIQFTMADGVSDDLSKHYPSITRRGHKADLYEGGHRVPFVARWDGVVAPGSASDQPICLVDLFATCADIVGAEIADTAAEDSISILPILNGTAKGPVRETVVHHSINGSFSLRQGEWKLLFCPGSGGWSDVRPSKKPAENDLMPETGWLQLYQLNTDRSEQKNVIEQYPEVAGRMTELMKQIIKDGRSTPGAPRSNDGPATELYPSWLQGVMAE